MLHLLRAYESTTNTLFVFDYFNCKNVLLFFWLEKPLGESVVIEHT